MAQLVGTQVNSTLKIRARGNGWLGPVSPPDPPSEEGVLFVGGSNASNANPGTSAAPFATIQAAADVASPGTEIRIRDGVYRETVVPANSATQMNPITFTADTRPDGTLAEPIISGAELVPDGLWTLTATGVDSVLGPQGNIYHADIALPAPAGMAPRAEDATVVSSNTILAGNQIFIRGRRVNITAWPKRVDHESLMDRGNWFDASRLVEEPGANTNIASDPNFVLRLNLATNVNRLQNAGLPNIDWTDARVWDAFTYLPSTAPLTSWGNGYVEWPITSAGIRFQRGEVGNANRRSHHLQLYGAKALMTVGNSRNEWFYQPGRLFIRPPVDGTPPTGVEYKARNLGFDCTGRSYIHIKNINFFACEWTESGFDARSETAPGVPLNGGTAGNLLEGCRFRYLHHWDTRQEDQPNDRMRPENEWPLFVLRSAMTGYVMQHGLRLTGSGSAIRNCVISQAAGNGVLMSGEDTLLENNYIEETGHRSGWAGSVFLSVPNRATVTGNTMRRTYRSHIAHIGQNKDISYNDMSDFMMLSKDGGCIYGAGRYMGINLNSGETHDQNTQLNWWLAGRPPASTGVAQGGGLNTIQLAATDSATNNFYNGAEIAITSGTGVNQLGVITAYNGATRTATVTPSLSRENPNRVLFSPGVNSGYRIRRGLGTLAGAYDGTRIHHNWIHDSLCRARATPLPGQPTYLQIVGRAWYMDGDSDGAIFDHNVTWNVHTGDSNGDPEGVGEVGPYKERPFSDFRTVIDRGNPGALDPRYLAGRFNRYYNNTFATESSITVDAANNGGYSEGVTHSIGLNGEQALYPGTYNNNIYLRRHTNQGVDASGQQSDDPPGKLVVFKSTELGLQRSPNGTSSAPAGDGGYSIQPTSIFVNPGTRDTRPDQGLGFRLRTDIGNIAIGRGVRIDGTLDNNSNPITGIDDPSLAPGQSPDAGAYQTGGEVWAPGCNLDPAFIAKRPWEEVWV